MIHRHADRRLVFEQGHNRGFLLGDLGRHALVELEVADRIERHAVPFAMTFYVLAGTGRCEIDDGSHDLAPGDVLAVEPMVARGWSNLGDAPLRLLCVRTPEQPQA